MKKQRLLVWTAANALGLGVGFVVAGVAALISGGALFNAISPGPE